MKKFLTSTKGQIVIGLSLFVTALAVYAFGLPGLSVAAIPFVFGVTTTDLTTDVGAAIPYVGAKGGWLGPVRVTVPDDAVTNDIIKAVPVKAGWRIQGYFAKMVTQGAGTTITMDLGITGVAATGLESAQTLKGAADATMQSALADTWPAAGGYYVTTDDTVDVLLHEIDTMTTAPVFDLWLKVEDMDS